MLTRLAHRDTDLAGAALFAIAVAVGLVPELLPVVLAAAHGRGLSALAKVRIIVTRPAAVQDLAAMDVLCTDKTGTLTAGTPALVRWIGPDGGTCRPVLDHGVLHAVFTTERHNRLDAAILDATDALDHEVARAQYDRAAEFGFDYSRRRASVLLHPGSGDYLMITKGAVAEVLSRCTHLRSDGQNQPLDQVWRDRLATVCASLWADGLRLLAVAYRGIEDDTGQGPDIGWETGLTLIGFLAFTDPPKPDLARATKALAEPGCADGDRHRRHRRCGYRRVCGRGHPDRRTGHRSFHRWPRRGRAGPDRDHHDGLRRNRPACRRPASCGRCGRPDTWSATWATGSTTRPAFRAADIGLAVPEAVGVARYAADAIMLDKDLAVLHQGITTARHAALNATKYLKATLSANLGNVLSVLAASAFLPFLPMLPLQILVQNLGYDLAQLTLPLDNVDPEQVRRPHRWNSRDLLLLRLILRAAELRVRPGHLLAAVVVRVARRRKPGRLPHRLVRRGAAHADSRGTGYPDRTCSIVSQPPRHARHPRRGGRRRVRARATLYGLGRRVGPALLARPSARSAPAGRRRLPGRIADSQGRLSEADWPLAVAGLRGPCSR